MLFGAVLVLAVVYSGRTSSDGGFYNDDWTDTGFMFFEKERGHRPLARLRGSTATAPLYVLYTPPRCTGWPATARGC